VVTIQVVMNDGTGSYSAYVKEATTRGISIAGECTVRKSEPLYVRVRYENSEVIVDIFNDNVSVENCVKFLTEIKSKRLSIGFTAAVTTRVENPAFISYAVARAPSTPVTLSEDNVVEPSDGTQDEPGQKERRNKDMWVKMNNKVSAFGQDMTKSVTYVNSLHQESNEKMTRFESNVRPLISTLERVLNLATRKVSELDEDGKMVNILEQHIRNLEESISRVENALSVMQARMQQGQSIFDGADPKQRNIFDQVDLWFWMLVVQCLLVIAYFFYKMRKDRRTRF